MEISFADTPRHCSKLTDRVSTLPLSRLVVGRDYMTAHQRRRPCAMFSNVQLQLHISNSPGPALRACPWEEEACIVRNLKQHSLTADTPTPSGGDPCACPRLSIQKRLPVSLGITPVQPWCRWFLFCQVRLMLLRRLLLHVLPRHDLHCMVSSCLWAPAQVTVLLTNWVLTFVDHK